MTGGDSSLGRRGHEWVMNRAVIVWRRGMSEGGGECAFLSAAVSPPTGLISESTPSDVILSKHAREGSTDNTPMNSTILVTLNESKSEYT